jgi:hypothetical protein
MRTRIALAATLIAAGSSLAAAQNSMPAPKPAPPMTSAPASDTTGTQPFQPPPAARSGEKGLPVGEGAVNGVPVEIKRLK